MIPQNLFYLPLFYLNKQLNQVFKKPFLITLFLVLSYHVVALAQVTEVEIDSSAYGIELDSVVVRAWGSPRPLLLTPSAISVVSLDELQSDQQLHISNTLNRVPGIYMQSSNLNTNRLTVRGIGSRNLYGTSKIKAYWNGIPLTTAEVSTQIEDLDLSAIERVEIIKGPASSLYGAGLGGTLLFKSDFLTSDGNQISQQATIGSFGMRRNVSQIKFQKQKTHLYLNYNSTHWDGYRQNNEYNRESVQLFGAYKPDKRQQLSLTASLIQLKAFIPSSINRDTYINSPTSAAANWLNARGNENYNRILLGLSYSIKYSDRTSYVGSVFGSLFNNDEVRPFNILNEQQNSVGARSVFSYETSWLKKPLIIRFGTEIFAERYDWQTNTVTNEQLLTDQIEDRNYANLFSQIEWTWNQKTTFELGLNQNLTNYTRHQILANAKDRYEFNQIMSPRVSINYRLKNDVSIYLNGSHGFSPPSVQETLDPEGALNPDIQPEKGWNAEIGSRGSIISGKIFYDLVLYRMRINDLLVAKRITEDQFIGLNAGSSLHRGLEFDVKYILLNSFKPFSIDLFLRGEINDHKFKKFIDGDQDYSGNQLTGVPDRVINVGFNANHQNGLYGNLHWRYVSSMPITDSNDLYSEAFDVANLKIGFKKKLVKHIEMNLESGMMNVFDQKYASQILINAVAFGNAQPRYYYPGLPRNYYLSLRFKYNPM